MEQIERVEQKDVQTRDRRADIDRARFPDGAAADLVLTPFQLVIGDAYVVEQCFAFLREIHACLTAHEQFAFEFVFQFLNDARHGGLA